MNRHAKAASAGSSSGRGKRRARIGGAFVCVLALLAFAGSGASSALAAVPAKGVTGFFGSAGGGPGQFATGSSGIGGMAVNQSTGTVYAVDRGNNRVNVFDANGTFLRAFGRDVVAYGPGQSNETQVVAVAATSGAFSLTFKGDTTSNLPATASAAEVESELNALGTISAAGGSVDVSGGPGDATGSTPYRILFNGGPLAGIDVASLDVTNVSLADGSPASAIRVGTFNAGLIGFEICVPANGDMCKVGAAGVAVSAENATGGTFVTPQGIAINQVSGDVYVTNPGTSRFEQFDLNGNFIRTFGKDVVAAGFPGDAPAASAVQTLTVTATEGKYTLAFGSKETSELASSSTAAEIQTALTGLTSIGADNVTVDETSLGVFTITFAGQLANNPEPLITATSGPGEPLGGGGVSVVDTTTGSTGYEICVAASGAACQGGTSGATGGAVDSALGYPTVAPVGAPNAGNLLAPDATNRRVQEFSPTGAFIRAFGFDVAKAGPGNTGATFEVCDAAAGDACQAGVAGSGSGQFATATPTRVAEDASGNIYTVEPLVNFRVQKFTLPGNVVTPGGVFAEADLKGTAAASAPTDVAVSPTSGNVLVNKGFVASATPSCPITGSISVAERRVVEVSAAGVLEGTHGTCAGITPANGLAMRGATGNVYVSSTFVEQRIYVLNTGQPTAPGVSITNVSAVDARRVTINGLISPNGPELPYGNETTYKVEYKRSTDVGFSTFFATEASAGNRTTSKAVAISLDGLQPSTSYDVRLIATKGLGSGTASQTVSFSTAAAPPEVVIPTYATVGGTQANLTGTVNPSNQATSYRFEYVDETGFEANGFQDAIHVPASGASAGSGTSAVAALQTISDLEPGASYRYRLIAANSSGQSIAAGGFTVPDPGICSNQALRLEQASEAVPAGSSYLPSCMALEMVSPPKKYNQKAEGPSFSANGRAIRFISLAALADTPQLGTLNDPYVAQRTSSGWTTYATKPPPTISIANENAGGPCAFNAALTRWTAVGTTAGERMRAVANVFTGSIDGSFSPLSPFLNPINVNPVPTAALFPNCEGGSVDASRLFFGLDSIAYLSGDPIPTEGSGQFFPNTYEAYLDGDGTPTAELLARDKGGTAYGGSCGAVVGWKKFAPEAARGAISPDGSRVYFSTRPTQAAGSACSLPTNKLRIMKRLRSPAGAGISQLIASECTRVSPACSLLDGDENFIGASLEGDKVYFTSTRQLTNSDLDTGAECAANGALAPGQSRGCDLYLYDAALPAGARLTQVSVGDANAPTPGKGSEVLGVADMSGDGTRVYFVAAGVLTTDPNAVGRTAEPGKPNLYLYQRDSDNPGSRTLFIGTLSNGDANQVPGGAWGQGPGGNSATAVPLLGPDIENSSVGGDGHILVFKTVASLTPDDLDAGNADYFRYDSDTESLERISRAAPGGSDNGGFAISSSSGSPAPAPSYVSFGRQVSEDGNTVVFTTSEALDPADLDGAGTAYVWRDGVVTAIRGSLGVLVGQASLKPVLSPSGEELAFVSSKQLLPQDGDVARDIYVARTNGGFPIPDPPDPCQGETCQNPTAGHSGQPSAPSEAFVGPGNQSAQARCRKGFVRKRGNCLKRNSKKRNQHRKSKRTSHKQGGQK